MHSFFLSVYLKLWFLFDVICILTNKNVFHVTYSKKRTNMNSNHIESQQSDRFNFNNALKYWQFLTVVYQSREFIHGKNIFLITLFFWPHLYKDALLDISQIEFSDQKFSEKKIYKIYEHGLFPPVNTALDQHLRRLSQMQCYLMRK